MQYHGGYKNGKTTNLRPETLYQKKESIKNAKHYSKQVKRLLGRIKTIHQNNMNQESFMKSLDFDKEIRDIMMELQLDKDIQYKGSKVFPNVDLSRLPLIAKILVFTFLATEASGKYINTKITIDNIMEEVCGEDKKLINILHEGENGETMTALKKCLPNVEVEIMSNGTKYKGNNPETRKMIQDHPDAYFSPNPNNIFNYKLSMDPEISETNKEQAQGLIKFYEKFIELMKEYVQVPTSNDNNIKTLKISIRDLGGPNGMYIPDNKTIVLKEFSPNDINNQRIIMHEFDHFASNIGHTHTNIGLVSDSKSDIAIKTSLFDREKYNPENINSVNETEISNDIYGANYPTNYHHVVGGNNTIQSIMAYLKMVYPNVPELKNEIFNYITPVQLAKLQKIYGINENSPVDAIELIKKYPNLVLEGVPSNDIPSNDIPPYTISIVVYLIGLITLSCVPYFATNTENQPSANSIINEELPRFAERECSRNTENIQTQI